MRYLLSAWRTWIFFYKIRKFQDGTETFVPFPNIDALVNGHSIVLGFMAETLDDSEYQLP